MPSLKNKAILENTKFDVEYDYSPPQKEIATGSNEDLQPGYDMTIHITEVFLDGSEFKHHLNKEALDILEAQLFELHEDD